MKTCDLVDKYQDVIEVPHFIGLRHFGGIVEFRGVIQTLQCHNDNSLLKQILSTAGEGRILVVDGAGSTTCALMGDKIAALGITNNWKGIIINGCIRDSNALASMNFGVMALGTTPQKSAKLQTGSIGISIEFAGARFEPGMYLYVDEDGLVLSKEELK